MTKTEINKYLAGQNGLTIKQANETVECFLNLIKQEVKDGNKIQLTGFGIFEPKVQATRIATNLHTGEKINVPSKKVVKFKPSKAFKESLNDK